jgi:hypothetical protein
MKKTDKFFNRLTIGAAAKVVAPVIFIPSDRIYSGIGGPTPSARLCIPSGTISCTAPLTFIAGTTLIQPVFGTVESYIDKLYYH